MFDWAEYLTLAEELGTRTSSEAALRTAISRAYYSAFCMAAWHRYPDGPPLSQQRDSHTVIWNEYRQCGRDSSWIGLLGSRLKAHRINADYVRDFPGDLAKTTEQAIHEAHKVVSYCKQHGHEPTAR